MKRTTRLFTAYAIATAFSSLAVPAHAQFMGIFQGVTNAIGQVAGKAANKAFAGKGEDLQAAYDGFFGHFDAQTAGMDAASKRQLRAMMDQKWPSVESAILLKNAQLQRDKDGPLLDIKQVAGAAIGGVALQAGMNNVLSGVGGGLSDTMRSAAMGGIIEGAQTKADQVVSGQSAVSPSSADLKFTPGDSLHPLVFFGRHPRDLSATDLYRENGFLGWKRMERSQDAEAYAPVTGEGQARYAVFTFDPQTGAVKAAFRVLAASPIAFASAVTAYSKMLGAEPRYASAGSVLRAVWETGAFVTADASKLTAGWSNLVPAMYVAAGSRSTSN